MSTMNGSTITPPPTSSAATSSDKLSGQLIIKAQLGEDIRKMMIHNEDLTLNELVLMMERVFAGKISNSDELTIKYLDDDGDKITLLNDSDLTVALHFHKLLRLFVLVNGKEPLNNESTENVKKEGSLIDAKTFRTELQQIRNSVQTILDRFQLSTNQNTANQQEKEASTAVSAPPSVVASSTAREFDPYKHLNQKQRSLTPDSIRSKSSNSAKTTNHEQGSSQPTSSVPAADNQYQHPSSESADANRAPPTSFPQTQMPTPHFVPTGYGDQQSKTSPYGAPPSSYPGMPPLPTAAAPPSRFPSAFPPAALPNANASSAFNPTSAPPPSSAGQTSTFIGQQQQQHQQPTQPSPFVGQQQATQPSPLGPPPTAGGFYSQQQNLSQQRPTFPNYNNSSNAFSQQQQQQPGPPPSSSSPATINPSFVQPTAMPTPPPLASQQPYGGYQPQHNFFNPTQPYAKSS